MIGDAIHVMVSGGPVMVALAITSLLLYKTIIGLLMFVRRVRFDEFADRQLRQLPGLAGNGNRNAVGTADDGGNGNGNAADAIPPELQVKVLDETLWRFKQLVRGRLRYSHALIIAAPLFGLLGTVEGMLATFRGQALDLSHEVSRAVADGISRALITTATGLFVAIPAVFLINWIKREFQQHELRFLARKTQLLARTEN